MAACCVSACKNLYSSKGEMKFFRIPSTYGPSRANRRRLWLKAIEDANGGVLTLKPNIRICGAHFISGEASMDYNDPDFVPSVFPRIKTDPVTKEKVKWRYGCRKTQRCKAKVNYAEETDSLDGQSSDQEEAQTLPSAPLPKEEETSTEAATSTSASVCSQESERTSDLQAKMPTLCLWSVFVPLAGYLCELCSRTFSHASELVKHKQLHENPVSCEVGENISTEQEEVPKHAPEPSFPCNMCDRSFTTNQSLKRHKLLHVKDGRRCPKCGQIFCQLHNHVLFMPLPKTEHNSTTEESLSQDTDLSSESSSDPSDSLEDAPLLEEPEQDPESSAAESEPLSETQNPLPPASHLQIPTEIPQPKLRKVPSRQVSSYSRDDYPTDYIQLHLPRRPQLPPSLQVFSPQRLTSAFLEVRRNYEYILNKPVNVATGQYTAYELENVL